MWDEINYPFPNFTGCTVIFVDTMTSHERHGVSNQQQIDCLHTSLFGLATETSKHCISGPLWREAVTGIFHSQMASNAVTGEFPAQRPVTRSFDVLFDLRLDRRLSKRSRRWSGCPAVREKSGKFQTWQKSGKSQGILLKVREKN